MVFLEELFGAGVLTLITLIIIGIALIVYYSLGIVFLLLFLTFLYLFLIRTVNVQLSLRRIG